MMEVTINGKKMSIDEARTVLDLIQSRDLKPNLVAVEHNGQIIPRSEFEHREIQDGDQFEIVHFVGGG
jgi:thiamine biosynthesis protein ThiS